MTGNKRWDDWRITPERTREWTLALYPAAILLVVVFLIFADREITGDMIGLFIGLLTAAGLQFAVRKNGGKDADSSNTSSSSGTIRFPSSEVLEDDDRGGTHNFNRWRDFVNGVRRRQSSWLPV